MKYTYIFTFVGNFDTLNSMIEEFSKLEIIVAILYIKDNYVVGTLSSNEYYNSTLANIYKKTRISY